MMTSSNGNIFRVTGHLCGEFTGQRWTPPKASDGSLMFSFICVWINSWVNNREAGDLRRFRAHYDVIVMSDLIILDELVMYLLQINSAYTDHMYSSIHLTLQINWSMQVTWSVGKCIIKGFKWIVVDAFVSRLIRSYAAVFGQYYFTIPPHYTI